MTHLSLRRRNRWSPRAMARLLALLPVVLGAGTAGAAKGKGTPEANPAGPNVPIEEHVLW